MATHNDITGDKIKTKPPSDAYRNGYDLIFNRIRLDSNEWYLKTPPPSGYKRIIK